MIVVMVDTKSLNINSIEDGEWIFRKFECEKYQHIWIFEGEPIFSHGKILSDLVERGVPYFITDSVASFILYLMQLEIWVDVERFIICSKNEAFIPWINEAVSVCTGENSVYDFAYFVLNGIDPEVYPDYAVIMDEVTDVNEDAVIDFLKNYCLEDIRHELVIDEVLERDLGVLLEKHNNGKPFFEELIEKKNKRFKISEYRGNFRKDFIIEQIYKTSNEKVSIDLKKWRSGARRIFYKNCRKCLQFIKPENGEELGNPVLWDGLSRGIIVIGEAPGMEEEKREIPFVGESGKLLEKWLDIAGLKRENCWITNAVLCRRKKMNMSLQPTDDMLSSCSLRLYSEIYENFVNNRLIIICLGKTALRGIMPFLSMYGFSNVNKHGIYKGGNIILLFLPHPSFILRETDGNKHLQVIDMLKRFKGEIQNANG